MTEKKANEVKHFNHTEDQPPPQPDIVNFFTMSIPLILVFIAKARCPGRTPFAAENVSSRPTLPRGCGIFDLCTRNDDPKAPDLE
jgi:hypothetical protein